MFLMAVAQLCSAADISMLVFSNDNVPDTGCIEKITTDIGYG